MTTIATATFQDRKVALEREHQTLIEQKNEPLNIIGNGIYQRYKNPVVTAAHVPLNWRFDFNEETNPFLQERIGMNAAFNAGAIKWNGKYLLAVRVEGIDRKSFFAIAESQNGIDNFKFWEKPCVIPQTEEPDTNVYDMRLVNHEDGWVYGIFCTERKDPKAPKGDTSSAVANAGIVRSKDLVNWERLPDLISNTGQQRNVVLHPEFVNGKYALYTRPQDGFIDVGAGGGIGLGYVDDMANPVVKEEKIIFGKHYHTIYELKNGLGPAPIKTEKGWLHLAHGVRNTAAGLRYTLYMFMTDLNDISKVTHVPAGHFMGPEGIERVGDVSNVLFSNGWIEDEDGTVYVYYASSDTRMHVAVSSVEKLVDYVTNTPADSFISAGSVETIISQIEKNNAI
ncbi:glycoside hydrolase family 130 protein [Flavobacterium limi]|uniref:4-O-beta-D-mannosyl-D-glucose phosphorylase n=1 Tax=Flavobacterium limi TaxID=2045105 RepID=A0ABQ1UAZ2_9FLAO|nr:glycosidase [Flavobacterium limi]GGF12174.1 4-O-beta-D-mannosyl-D-glucose phosphorylase [Flavobacterium limi]